MDHQYGIAVTNKFALFIDEDEDPFDAIAKNKSKKDAEKKAKSKQKKNTPVVEEKSTAPENEGAKKKEGGDKPVSRQNDRGKGSARSREPRELRENEGDKRPPRRQAPRENKDGRVGDENVPPEFRERPEGGFKRREDREGGGGFGGGFAGERGRGRGRGRSRGGRGGDRGASTGGGFGPRGDRKREFDRHSASDRTGVKPVEKKEGGGAHNWGSFRDDIEEQGQVNPSEESGDWGNQQEKSSGELNESTEADNVAEEEAQPQQMTLDEWKALQTQSKPKPEFNIRQAGEGVDSGQWKKGVEYQKKQEASDHEDDDYEEGEHSDHHSRNNKQLVTDIRITFNDNPRRGRGRRGGRGGMERGAGGGGSRGGRGSARGFGGNKKEAAPRFDDESDFPSLLKTAA